MAIGLSFLIFLLVMGIGSSIIMWQVSENIEIQLQSRLSHAVSRLDKVIGHARSAANEAATNAGMRCTNEVLLKIRQIVTTTPDVRTVNLATNDTIYCSSLFGLEKRQVQPANYFQGQLLLLNGSPVTPYNSLLAYRSVVGKNSILIGIDGYYLQNTLALSSVSAPLLLRVGGAWMSEDGTVYQSVPPVRLDTRSVTSSLYGYQIFTTLPSLMSWPVVWKYAIDSLLIFLTLSLLLAWLTYRLLIRQTTPQALLAQAVSRHQFIPFMQPIVDGKTFQLVGAEVLVRWAHPKTGIIPPALFIPLAEQSGLIIEITEQITHQVSQFLLVHQELLPLPFFCCINVSARHFQDERLLSLCRQFIHTLSYSSVTLVLELTERELIIENDATHVMCKTLRELGVIFAIDDFGTGNANLAYLKQFSAELIKIDKQFIQAINNDLHSEHIVNNILTLSGQLQFSTVAEGIETQKQANSLQRMGVTYMQGYFFGRPLPLEDFSATYFDGGAQCA